MAAPQWSDQISIIPLQKLAKGSVARGVFNVQSLYGGRIFARAGRLTTTAPAVGVFLIVRQVPWDNTNLRRLPHPSPIAQFQDPNLAAAASTTLSAGPAVGGAYSATNITNVTNASPAVITATAHGLQIGDAIKVASVGGTTAVNASGNVGVTSFAANTFTIQQAGVYINGNGAYTSGGTVSALNTAPLTSTTGFTAPPTWCAIVDSTSSPTRCEWSRSSVLASSNLSMDVPFSNYNIASADTITSLAFVSSPIYLDGGPYPYNVEVLFDYGSESAASTLIVEAWGQTLNSIS